MAPERHPGRRGRRTPRGARVGGRWAVTLCASGPRARQVAHFRLATFGRSRCFPRVEAHFRHISRHVTPDHTAGRSFGRCHRCRPGPEGPRRGSPAGSTGHCRHGALPRGPAGAARSVHARAARRLRQKPAFEAERARRLRFARRWAPVIRAASTERRAVPRLAVSVRLSVQQFAHLCRGYGSAGAVDSSAAFGTRAQPGVTTITPRT